MFCLAVHLQNHTSDTLAVADFTTSSRNRPASTAKISQPCSQQLQWALFGTDQSMSRVASLALTRGSSIGANAATVGYRNMESHPVCSLLQAGETEILNAP